ncbi:MAG: archaeal flagellin N-terminal-like domain protein [uncultured archaeon A07HB70]|nr:MAG: archaeal flagellin N-terminal-like domain protein [uncultured archaeon A07HB70]
MELRTLLTDDRAVSPVIGVILMVAITVILAAVIGTFVLGLGQDVQSTPSASFDFDFNSSNNNVTVVHTGGDSLVEGDNAQDVNVTTSTTTSDWFANETDISAGDSQSANFSSGDTVRVVWTGTSGESSAVLAEQDAPA